MNRPPTLQTVSTLIDIMHGSALAMMIGHSTPISLNDLRLRVLDGEDLTAEEMLLICNEIRQGRRAAARPEGAAKTRKPAAGSRVPVSSEDLKSLLEQSL